MATTKIDTHAASACVPELERIRQDLIKIQEDVRRVDRSLASSTGIAPYLKITFARMEDAILDYAAHADTLSQALDRILDLYTEAENNVLKMHSGALADLSAGRSDADAPTWFKDIMERVRLFLLELGIIKAERQERIDGQPVTKAQEREMDLYMKNEIRKLKKNKRYSENTWRNASVEERKEILNEYLQEVSKILGIPIGPINFTHKEGQYSGGKIYYNMGSYSPDLHMVSINQWVIENPNLDSYALITTITHEMRHAYQQAACDNPDKYVVSEETIASWQESIDNYKSQSDFMVEDGMSSQEAYEAYRNQTIERDARDFAGQS